MSPLVRAHPRSFMIIAGEASGDALAAELVQALRETAAVKAWPFAPRFFGAGGPRLAQAGVELAFDLTQHAVVGFAEVVWRYPTFRRLFRQLLALALARQPDVIIGVDYSGFNRRFARAVRRCCAAPSRPFHDWQPRLVQYVSPQVWASRPGRARALAHDLDLLLCLFPFEREWYARRVPALHVECVGHPLLDRHPAAAIRRAWSRPIDALPGTPLVLLLPGSRPGELQRHLPVMLAAANQVSAQLPARFVMVVPDEALGRLAASSPPPASGGRERGGARVEVRVGGLAEALTEASLAIASTGTVTLECALFGVPTVALYRTSWPTYLAGRLSVTVPYLAMPNLLAGEPVFPEFVQGAASPGKLAAAAIGLLTDRERRRHVRAQLERVVQLLGGPGASQRAAAAIASLLTTANRSKEPLDSLPNEK